jgi:hypothetical protein
VGEVQYIYTASFELSNLASTLYGLLLLICFLCCICHFRQLSGGTYFVAVDQIISSLQLQRMRLFHRIEVKKDEHTACVLPACCTVSVEEEELEALDASVLESDAASESEEAALYYVCGYVAASTGEGIQSPIELCNNSEFVVLVSRGKLSHPKLELFQFARMAYCAFHKFRHISEHHNCSNRCAKLFEILLAGLPIEIKYPRKVCRILANVFHKGFINKEEATLKISSPPMALCERKQRKLQAL